MTVLMLQSISFAPTAFLLYTIHQFPPCSSTKTQLSRHLSHSSKPPNLQFLYKTLTHTRSASTCKDCNSSCKAPPRPHSQNSQQPTFPAICWSRWILLCSPRWLQVRQGLRSHQKCSPARHKRRWRCCKRWCRQCFGR